MNRLAAGRLRHRITFEAPEIGQNATTGARVPLWVEQFNGDLIPAEIVALSGAEILAAGAAQSKINTRIVLRYRPGIAASWRAMHRGQAYNIEAVIPDPDSTVGHVTLMCSSGLNNG